MDVVSHHHKYYHMIIHESSSSPSKSPFLTPHPHSSHSSFPIIAVAIIGILATIFLLVFYYIFVIKCCLNWHRIDILRRFSLSRNRNHQNPLIRHYSPPLNSRGLDDSVIRSIPIFHFHKSDSDSGSDSDRSRECAVCLCEFQHDEKLRLIPNCAHSFHIDCIDVWLQNNSNCPLCRTSISISIPTHFPRSDQQSIPPPTSDFHVREEDYVVIEFGCSGGGGGATGGGDDYTPNSGEYSSITPLQKKLGKKLRKKRGQIASMGDECIDMISKGKGDDQFSIQPIRRSFSMNSASDRQLYSAVQEIMQGKTMNNVDGNEVSLSSDEGCSNGGLRRGFFSFGHARSAVLPIQLEP